jgi:hypothetical protein
MPVHQAVHQFLLGVDQENRSCTSASHRQFLVVDTLRCLRCPGHERRLYISEFSLATLEKDRIRDHERLASACSHHRKQQNELPPSGTAQSMPLVRLNASAEIAAVYGGGVCKVVDSLPRHGPEKVAAAASAKDLFAFISIANKESVAIACDTTVSQVVSQHMIQRVFQTMG